MDLAKLLSPKTAFVHLRSTTKKQALKELSLQAEHATGLDDGEIFSVLMDREHAGVTAVGDGVAMPRGQLSSLDKTHAFVATLAKPVEFGAADGVPVDIIFLLLSPDSGQPDYLKAMAAASRLLREPSTCRAVRATKTSDDLYAVIAHASSNTKK